MEIEHSIDEVIARLGNTLRGRPDAPALLRRLFDGLSEELLKNTSTDHITAANVVMEVIDENSGRLYRRYLELGYQENDNGIRLVGETLAGAETAIVFLSETALKKMHDLRGAGRDTPRCKEN
ncbi:hypothetical protein ACYULU_13350 [Breznakiellaceae bacterium SP9]